MVKHPLSDGVPLRGNKLRVASRRETPAGGDGVRVASRRETPPFSDGETPAGGDRTIPHIPLDLSKNGNYSCCY
ncbi:MAG TPA: hypothetical protein VK184_21440 [Nostocaceae cyanobacterium]|nr:hypothetical protein [Nostocaceae cyanobacterium]